MHANRCSIFALAGLLLAPRTTGFGWRRFMSRAAQRHLAHSHPHTNRHGRGIESHGTFHTPLAFLFPASASASFYSSSSTTNMKKEKSEECCTQQAPTSLQLFEDWMHHDDVAFHHFSNDEAEQIRNALLTWYRVNRRKLPWRGDAPPFDGSTASKKRKRSSSSSSSTTKGKQTNLTSFFATKSTPSDATNRRLTRSAKKMAAREQSADQDEAISGGTEQCNNADTPVEKAIAVSAYGVWVSEIMLQQTRVEAVIPFWCKWMKSFPSVHDLAAASEDDVNAHWAGLGFYRRARLLHRGAKDIVQRLDGNVPNTVEELLKIDGIGPYTASAIASIAFGRSVPVVDGNVCRVLSRLTGIANHIKSPALKDKHGWDLARQIVEAGDGQHAGQVNQAMMELGATYCAPSGTGMDEKDPLKSFYMSTRLGRMYGDIIATTGQRPDRSMEQTRRSQSQTSGRCVLCDPEGVDTALDRFQEITSKFDDSKDDDTGDAFARAGHEVFPLAPPKAKRREEDLAVACISVKCDGAVWWLLIKRPSEGLLAGQWEFPAVLLQIREKEFKVPKPRSRKSRLTAFLDEISNHDNDEENAFIKRQQSKAPIEHIFSHVKHVMWVEYLHCEGKGTTNPIQAKSWTTPDEREVRWMREADMMKVGITARVKKIMKVAKQQITTTS